MGAAFSSGASLGRVAAAGVGGLLVLAAATAAVLSPAGDCTPVSSVAEAPASTAARETIPAGYLTLYRQAGGAYAVPWTVIAAIGAIETDHGRSRLPGVQSGVNAFGCCAGPMQFNLRDGPPSTWQTYRVDGDGDGTTDPYAPADAIASAGHYLHVLLQRAGGDVRAAVFGYNHSAAYVADVLARARRFGDGVEVAADSPPAADCSGRPEPSGGAELDTRVRRSAPRAFTALPAWAMAGDRPPGLIDARLLDDALWLLTTFRLRVSAAREAGHHTHGDGTALDLVPAQPTDQAAWDASTGAAARALGWDPSCGASGVRPICRLVPAIQFVGYEGYPGHGSPRTCSGGCAAHLHVSWVSPCYGTSVPSQPCTWVSTFALGQPAGGAPEGR